MQTSGWSKLHQEIIIVTHQDVVVTVSVEVRLGTPVPLENNLPSTIIRCSVGLHITCYVHLTLVGNVCKWSVCENESVQIISRETAGSKTQVMDIHTFPWQAKKPYNLF